MGNVDGVPLASQVKSVVQVTRGDFAGAADTQNKFSQKCLGAAQVRSFVEVLGGDLNKAADTQKRFLQNARELMGATPEDPANLVDALPVLSQLKSTACFLDGRREEARATQDNFTKHFPVVSQTRSLLEVVSGRPNEALETQKAFMKFTSRVMDKVPLLGHAKAVVHRAVGEHERAEQAMNEANRVTRKTTRQIGTALTDMLNPSVHQRACSSDQEAFGREQTDINAEPLSAAEIAEHTLTLHIAAEQVQSHGACPICIADFEVGETCTTLRCFHLFHTNCCTQWLGQSGNCPVCRVPAMPEQQRSPGGSSSRGGPAGSSSRRR